MSLPFAKELTGLHFPLDRLYRDDESLGIPSTYFHGKFPHTKFWTCIWSASLACEKVRAALYWDRSFHCPCWASLQPQIQPNSASLYLFCWRKKGHTHTKLQNSSSTNWPSSSVLWQSLLCRPPASGGCSPALLLPQVLHHSNQCLLWNLSTSAHPLG